MHDGKIVSFGKGTLQLTSAYIEGRGVLGLETAKEVPVGESRPINKSEQEIIHDLMHSEVLLRFDNTKSLEVLILKLQEVRAMMLGCDISVVEEWKQNHNITSIYCPNPSIDGIAKNGDQHGK